jgi:hypothetical protein
MIPNFFAGGNPLPAIFMGVRANCIQAPWKFFTVDGPTGDCFGPVVGFGEVRFHSGVADPKGPCGPFGDSLPVFRNDYAPHLNGGLGGQWNKAINRVSHFVGGPGHSLGWYGIGRHLRLASVLWHWRLLFASPHSGDKLP